MFGNTQIAKSTPTSQCLENLLEVAFKKTHAKAPMCGFPISRHTQMRLRLGVNKFGTHPARDFRQVPVPKVKRERPKGLRSKSHQTPPTCPLLSCRVRSHTRELTARSAHITLATWPRTAGSSWEKPGQGTRRATFHRWLVLFLDPISPQKGTQKETTQIDILEATRRECS